MNSPRSIRTELFILPLAIAVAFTGLLLNTAYIHSEQHTEQVRKLAFALADQTAHQTEQFLADSKAFLAFIAREASSHAVDAQECEALLNDSLEPHPHFADISLVDPLGHIVCSTAPDQAMASGSADSAAWFRSVIRANVFVVSEPVVSPFSGRRVAVLSYPVQGSQGQVGGAVAASIDLGSYLLIQAGVSLPPGSTTTIVNDRGIVIARSLDTEHWIGQAARDTEIVEIVLAKAEGQAQAHGVDGIEKIYAFTTVEGLGWHVYVGIPVEVIFGPIRALNLRNGLVVIAIVLSGAALALYLARQVERPVHALAEVAEAVAQGRMDRRARVQGPREIARVASEFNRMLDVGAQREQQLQRSEAHYRRLVELAQEGIGEIDAEARITFVNARLAAMLGYSVDEMIGVPLAAFMDDEGWATAAPQLERRRQGIGGQHDFKLQRKDGSDLWIIVSVAPIFDAQGQYSGGLALLTDITERKRVEEALRHSEERFRTSVETLLDGFAICSPLRDEAGHIVDFKYEYINEAGCQLNQRRRDEHIGHTILELLPQKKETGLIEEYAKVVETGQTLIKDAPDEGGEFRPGQPLTRAFDYRATKLGEAVVVVWRDITERKKAELALQESESRFRQLAENIQEVFWMMEAGRRAPIYASPAFADIYGRPAESVYEQPEDWLESVYSEDRQHIVEAQDRQANGEHTVEEYRVVRPDGSVRWIRERAFPIRDKSGQVYRIAGLTEDITERKRAEAGEREQRLFAESLRDTAAALTSTLDLNTVMKRILVNVDHAVPHDAANVMLIEGNIAHVIHCKGYPAPMAARLLIYRFAVDEVPTFSHMKTSGKPCLVPSTTAEPGWMRLDRDEDSWTHSYIGVPIQARGQVIGFLNLDSRQDGFFTPIDATRLQAFADQAAIAIENARSYDELEQRVKARTAELAEANAALQREVEEREQAEAAEREQRLLAESLRNIAAALNHTLDLDEVLKLILRHADQVVPHDAAYLLFVESGVARVVGYQDHLRQDPGEVTLVLHFPVADIPALQHMLETNQPLTIPDMRGHSTWTKIPGAQGMGSFAGAPIRLGREVIGFLSLFSHTPAFFTATHAERLQVFADQAAVAVQNARLYAQARQVAVVEERNRIAHDLHDAVSQTLWSASLIADVLPAVWERNPEEGRQSLTELHQLTSGALAEMRTLLLELRPTALLQGELGEMLRYLTEAFTGRTGISVSLVLHGGQAVAADVQVALYRIAQEALNNVARHAAATEVTVYLDRQPEAVELSIADNGRGFQHSQIPPGHLGLGIMRERAESIGATLDIASKIGQGTTMTVVWSLKKGEETG